MTLARKAVTPAGPDSPCLVSPQDPGAGRGSGEGVRLPDGAARRRRLRVPRHGGRRRPRLSRNRPEQRRSSARLVPPGARHATMTTAGWASHHWVGVTPLGGRHAPGWVSCHLVDITPLGGRHATGWASRRLVGVTPLGGRHAAMRAAGWVSDHPVGVTPLGGRHTTGWASCQV